MKSREDVLAMLAKVDKLYEETDDRDLKIISDALLWVADKWAPDDYIDAYFPED
jgi:hypothetical protein